MIGGIVEKKTQSSQASSSRCCRNLEEGREKWDALLAKVSQEMESMESWEVIYCEKEGCYRDPGGVGEFIELPI
ncbi:unnamed protein product [Arabis nemorensis]|uniref:Uncharacterized protein n=1 Tax=Arabis nemorensis TaxID=586526 RepID=A0A565BAY3_9BRAS|nr:unnamed protein product [Arabis nemorensis]